MNSDSADQCVSGIKKGINQLSFPDKMGLVDCMKLARKAGFQGFEPVLRMEGEFSLESTDNQILECGKAAREIGITITSICQQQHRHYSLASNNDFIRKCAKDAIKRLIDVAHLLNVRNILVVPGSVYLPPLDAEEAPKFQSTFFAGSETVDYDVVYERSVQAFKELSGYAEKKQVCMCIENIWNWFLLSPLEMRAFIDEIGSDYAQVYFDVGNITAVFGFAEQWIRILGNRIKVVHFKDYRRLVGTRSGYVDLLSGDVDFAKVMKSLKNIGYSGWLNAEVFPKYKNTGEQIIYNTSASMDQIIRLESF
jgi:L-ribulose-5-phosphate 3-epimerase